MMNLAMMELAMMNFDVAPGVMVGVMGPLLGVIGAMVFTGVAYGFAVLGYAAVHRNDRPTRRTRVTTLEPARHAA